LRGGGSARQEEDALDRDNVTEGYRNHPSHKKSETKTGALPNNSHPEQRGPMNPDYYECICTAVEEKFGVTPEFVRAEYMLGLREDENPVVILNIGTHTVVVQVPDTSVWDGVDRLLGNLEAKLVRQMPMGEYRRVRYVKEP
jgi:hypothetical protein